MELRQLRHFLVAAEAPSLRQAAERLNIAQPALSQSIRKLEESIGVVLFERSRQGIVLTRAGRVFLSEARKTVAQAKYAKHMAKELDSRSQRIRLGCVGGAMFRILPTALSWFREKWPEVTIHIEQHTHLSQVIALHEDRLDFAIFNTVGLDISGLHAKRIEGYGFVAAIPALWPISLQPSIGLSDVADMPFALPPRDLNPGLRELVDSACARAGFSPHVAFETTDTFSIARLVSGGLALSFMPETFRMMQMPAIVCQRVDDFVQSWDLYLVWKREPKGAAERALRDAIVKAIPDQSI